MKLLKYITLGLFAATVSSCVNDDFAEPSADCADNVLTVTKTVQEIINQVPPVVDPAFPYTGDDVIEAYVVSSDEGGNFYKSISLQTKPAVGQQPVAFSVPVDIVGAFTNYPVGMKVYIKMKDQYTDIYNGSMRIGSAFQLDSGDFAVGRISMFNVGKVVVKSCTTAPESELVRTLTIPQALNDANLNTLIELDGVQFVDEVVGRSLYEAANDLGGATNHLLQDRNNNRIIFRTSSFASFAGDIATQNSGKVRGILTKFGSDYQFLARTTRDIMLDQPRLAVDLAPTLVGSQLNFVNTLNENFESYTTTSPANRSFPAYVNDPFAGSRYWEVRTFGGNKYIQMSSFGGTPEDNRTLFYVPVNFGTANTFSFQSKAGFTNGAVLKVYYITAENYTPGAIVNSSNLVDITSSFTISAGLTSGYPANFTNSGSYAIPASLTGNGYFVFEYVGSGLAGLTTTMQIDNIVIN